MENIESVIQSSGIQRKFDTWSGDCSSVAIAIAKTFKIQNPKFFATYLVNRDIPNKPYHVTVQINGDLYDGDGKLQKQELIEKTAKETGPQAWDWETSIGVAKKNSQELSLDQVRKTDCYSQSVMKSVSKNLKRHK